jgi:hypothetical protein
MPHSGSPVLIFPSQARHPIFSDQTIYQVNKVRREGVDAMSLQGQFGADRLKMEVYFNVKDLIEGAATEQEAFECIFRLMDMYAGIHTKR